MEALFSKENRICVMLWLLYLLGYFVTKESSFVLGLLSENFVLPRDNIA